MPWMISPSTGKWQIPTSNKWQVGSAGDACCCNSVGCSVCTPKVGTLTATFTGCTGFIAPLNGTWTVPFFSEVVTGPGTGTCTWTVAGPFLPAFGTSTITIFKDYGSSSLFVARVNASGAATLVFRAHIDPLSEADFCANSTFSPPTDATYSGSVVVTK